MHANRFSSTQSTLCTALGISGCIASALESTASAFSSTRISILSTGTTVSSYNQNPRQLKGLYESLLKCYQPVNAVFKLNFDKMPCMNEEWTLGILLTDVCQGIYCCWPNSDGASGT